MIDKKNIKIFDPALPNSQLIKLVKDIGPGIALDVGCGKGKNAIWLAQQGWEVDAFDPNVEYIGIARDKAAEAGARVIFSRADIASFQPDHQYDLIVCAMILHFFDDEQVVRSIEKMKHWTKPGGNIFMSVLNDSNPQGNRPKLFKKGELESYFTDWRIISSYQLQTEPILMPGRSKPETFYFDYLLVAKP